MTAALKVFPGALLHWEDFGPGNARRILDRYRDHILTFNDDMQGTGAVNLAAVSAGARASQTPLTRHRTVIFGPAPPVSASSADLVRWTGGRALIATGSPFGPVSCQGVTYQIGQADNALIFPGLGLGTLLSRARRITGHMITAAAQAAAGLTESTTPAAPLLPPTVDLRTTAAQVALAVARPPPATAPPACPASLPTP